MERKLSLRCFGGVGKVTGANFLLSGEPGSFLIDCGLIQGSSSCEKENYDDFGYDVSEVDSLFVTHAHLDHIGRIPRLVREGFKGRIFSTPETRVLAEIMFEDALSIFRHDLSKMPQGILYDEKDVIKTLSFWETLKYHENINRNGVLFSLKDAGHILGSSMVEVAYGGRKFVFTGDLGNSPSILLKDTEVVDDADYILMESVYGDRVHEHVDERDSVFLSTIKKVLEREGTVVIPSFSIERTQDLLFTLNNFVESGRLDPVPVFLDSPLAIRVTDIYKKSSHLFNDRIKDQIKGGDEIFNFPKLSLTLNREDSDFIHSTKGSKIILAGSGMSAGGRVTKHEIKYLPDKKNAIILVGYQSVGTVGRMLEDGVSPVSINGEKIPVLAEIVSIRGFSAHRDSDGLLSFVEKDIKKLRRVFVTMGEPRSSLFLVQRLRDYLGVDAVYPEIGKEYPLSFM